jgi:hypothetical protein
MKIKLLFIAVLIITTILSCKKDDDSVYTDDYIIAGQTNSNGISYHDLNPDINCYLADPWNITDTTIHLDLNFDGIIDFNINGSMLHPSALGGDWESVTITPLNDNEICIDLDSGWLDTIPKNDTINQNCIWSNNEALIYSYSWMMGEPSETSGLWINVTSENTYYIGLKILKANTPLYGWIGMKRDADSWSFNFQISDFAILRSYAL